MQQNDSTRQLLNLGQHQPALSAAEMVCLRVGAEGGVRRRWRGVGPERAAGATMGGLAIAVGETVILLTPSPFSRYFSMDGEGMSEK